MLPEFLLDSDDDWIEGVREWLYPKLHPLLEAFGGYGVGDLSDNQLVGKVDVEQEKLEPVLVDNGFIRNPIACYKSHPDGRESIGSWVLLPDDANFLKEQRQLHITIFESRTGESGVEIFAHNEYDWRQRPRWHLNGKNFDPEKGVLQASMVLSEEPRAEVENV